MANPERVRLTQGTGHPFLSLRTDDGRWVRLNSQHDPIAEADALIAPAFESREPALIIVIGLGLGYVLDAIERRSSSTKVLALEPVPASLSHMQSRRDWSMWKKDKRLRIFAGPDYPGASDTWTDLDAEAPLPPIVVHPVLAREAAADVARARATVEKIAFGAQANLNARKRFAGRYLLNTLKNLPVIAREGNAGALFDAFTSVPAIVVSAGPSLDRNIAALRQFQDRALLIAVDTALRPLLGSGIHPHLVVSVDPSEVNARHLANLPHPDRTWLVAEGSIDPIVFEQFEGRIFIFKVSNHHPWPWLKGLGIDRDMLRAWGSVATSTFDLAIKMGCDPIIFAGQDLAYTDGRPYCRGTTFEETWAAAVGAGEELPDIWARALAQEEAQTVNDIHRHAVVTTSSLVAFRDWIAQQATLLEGRTVINATGSGILEGLGLRQADLGSVLASLPFVRDLEVRVRERWSETIVESPADSRKTDAQLIAALTRARNGDELTTWASFAHTTTSALSPDIGDLTSIMQHQTAKTAPRSSAPFGSVVPHVDPRTGEIVQTPELVRAFTALLLNERVPNWARVAAATVDPRDPGASRKMLEVLPRSALQRVAERCEAGSAFEHAAKIYQSIAERAKDDKDLASTGSVMSRWFQCLFLAGSFATARPVGEALLPDDGPVLYLCGISQMIDDHDEAVAKIQGFIAAYPDVAGLRLNLAFCLATNGNLRDALELVEIEASRWPGRVHPEYARGVCHRLNGHHEAAANILEALVDDWPYAGPDLVIASIGTRQRERIECALRTVRRSFRNPVTFVIVPNGQEDMVGGALTRLRDELSSEHHHIEVTRVSRVGVRLFTQAADAWKPRWRP